MTMITVGSNLVFILCSHILFCMCNKFLSLAHLARTPFYCHGCVVVVSIARITDNLTGSLTGSGVFFVSTVVDCRLGASC